MKPTRICESRDFGGSRTRYRHMFSVRSPKDNNLMKGRPAPRKETVNLFDSGRHKDIIRKLTTMIYKWLENVGNKVKV